MAETSWYGPENMHSLVSIICFQLITFLRIYLTSLQLCEWDCVGAVERFSALHYSVDFFLSFGIIGLLWNFETIRGSLMRPKWPKPASLAQKICTL